MRMRLVCYWQGNIKQSLQLQEYLGFFRGVQRGVASPEGFLSSAAPNPAGWVEHTHVSHWKTQQWWHLTVSQSCVGPGEAALLPCARTTGFPLCPQAKGASPHRQISKCFDSATSENLHAQLFTKKPHHNLRDSLFLQRLSNLPSFTTSAFLGCLSCVALCCLLSKLIILSLLFAFYISLQPSQKKLTHYCSSMNCTFFHMFLWPMETLCYFSLLYSGPTWFLSINAPSET